MGPYVESTSDLEELGSIEMQNIRLACFVVHVMDPGPPARHGLQDSPSVHYTCLQDDDKVDHILVQCTYAQETWHQCFDLLQIPIHRLTGAGTFVEWWLGKRQMFGKDDRGFDTFFICTTWSLWK